MVIEANSMPGTNKKLFYGLNKMEGHFLQIKQMGKKLHIIQKKWKMNQLVKKNTGQKVQ